MGDVVADHSLPSGYLTNLRHNAILFLLFSFLRGG
jgi:hypothetical protein